MVNIIKIFKNQSLKIHFSAIYWKSEVDLGRLLILSIIYVRMCSVKMCRQTNARQRKSEIQLIDDKAREKQNHVDVEAKRVKINAIPCTKSDSLIR